MGLWGDLALLIAVQLVVGGVVVGVCARSLMQRRGLARRKWVRRAETSRLALRSAAAATPVAALLAATLWFASRAPSLEGPGGAWVPLLLGGVSACGCSLILAAGWSEARGRRRRAARRVDTAGRLMFLACAAYAGVLFGATLLATAGARAEFLPAPWSPVLFALAAIGLVLAGFVGLLAGLSRKPRPSGTSAGLLYLFSQWALLAAAVG